MEAAQKALTVRTEAATRAFASTSHRDSQRATGIPPVPQATRFPLLKG